MSYQDVSPTPRKKVGRNIDPRKIDLDFKLKQNRVSCTSDKQTVYFRNKNGNIALFGQAFALHRFLFMELRWSALEFAENWHRQFSTGSLAANLTPQMLSRWLQPTRTHVVPSPDYAPGLEVALRKLAAEHVSANLANALFEPWTEPSQALDALTGAGISPRAITAVDRFVRWSSSDLFPEQADPIPRHVSKIRDFLSGTTGRRHIVTLVGSPMSGKKSVITGLLARLPGTADGRSLPIADNRQIPVFARRVENHPEGIIKEILGFLHHIDLRDRQDTVRSVVTDTDTYLHNSILDPYDIDHLIFLVGQLNRRQPVCYILIDYPSYEQSALSLFHHDVMNRLIDTLRETNSETRILITTDRSLKITQYLSRDMRDAEEIILLKPSLAILAQLLNNLDEKYLKDVIISIRQQGDLRPDWLWLQLAAARLRIVADTNNQNLWAQTLAEIFRGLHNPNGEIKKMIEALMESLTEPERDALYLVAAVDDGMRLSSLGVIFDEERKGTMIAKPKLDDDNLELHREIEKIAERLSKLLGPVCVLEENYVPPVIEDPPEITGPDKLLDMETPLRLALQEVFSREDWRDCERFRWAMRVAAKRARFRSNWNRIAGAAIRGHVPSESDIRANTVVPLYAGEDVRRKAQIINLTCASVDSKKLVVTKRVTPTSAIDHEGASNKPDLPFESLVLEDAIFAPRPPWPTPHEILRFAYKTMFRDDLDHQYRLTLIHDRDDLRLCILLGFCRPGEIIRLDKARPLVPPDLVTLERVFKKTEIIDIITSIAVSGLRTGMLDLTSSAVAFAKPLAAKHGSRPTELERLWRAGIDADLLRGRGCADTNSVIGDEHATVPERPAVGSLVVIERRAQECLKLLKEQYEESKKKNQNHKLPDIINSLVRIITRIGRIHFLMNNYVLAKQDLIQLCLFLKWDEEPGFKILSGYGGRQFLRLLCELAESETDLNMRDRYIRAAHALHHLNYSRLLQNRRAYLPTVVDEMRISIVEGGEHYERAAWFLEHLPSPLPSGVRFPEQLDLDAVSADVALVLLAKASFKANSRLPTRDVLLDRAEKTIHRLWTVSDEASLPLYKAYAAVLAARLLVVGERLPGDSWTENVVKSRLEDANGIMLLTGYRSRWDDARAVATQLGVIWGDTHQP